VKLYDDYADWFHLLTHPKDYAEEADVYVRALRGALPEAHTLLELGAGGGNNAFYLKHHFSCTLTDLSPRMIQQSQGINPDCEHVAGDMRHLRLGRTFDVVFVHDAIEYLLTAEDRAQLIATVWAHTRPGGVALLLPDGTAETFAESTDHGGHDGPGGRGLRYLEWTFDPDPSDDTYEVHFACLLRESGQVRVIHDRHVHALVPHQAWVDGLRAAGFEMLDSPALNPDLHGTQVAFLVRKPAD
jgi:trans-aconitate methyltransferase